MRDCLNNNGVAVFLIGPRARPRAMASVQLVLGYLALALVIATVVVLFCLRCSCHVALGKCARWSCDGCRGTQSTEREQGAPVLAGRRRAPDACAATCLRAVPWLLTCGYCCGTFGDVGTTNRQRAESAGATTAVAVGQPVFEKGQLDATECVVAVSMPLLAVS